MFVVRIDSYDDDADFKAFERRADAERRFRVASVRVWNGEFPSAAWFSVDAGEVRRAIDAVRGNDARLAVLLDQEPRKISNISLEELGL